MDCLNLTSSFLPSSSLPPPSPGSLCACRRRAFSISPVSCSSGKPVAEDADGKRKSREGNLLHLLQISATVIVVSASLPQPRAHAKVSERKRPAKQTEAVLSPEELKAWSRPLPVVGDRIPYTEVLKLKEEGRLKHIIKHPGAGLRRRPDVVLVVLEDSRVLRTTLPSAERDEKFWEAWDEMQLGSLCINAYTPPIKKPSAPSPYLGFLARITLLFSPLRKAKPQSKRAMEIEKARRELSARRKAELAKVRKEGKMIEKDLRAKNKMKERKLMITERNTKFQQSLVRSREYYEYMGLVWAKMAQDKNFATVIALGFFPLFYYFVVYRYKKQQKDFEDRMKIAKVEAEERKKMRELERELVGLEGAEDEGEDEGDQQNTYLKMAAKFMQSGARVRRAHGKRPPQYMEKDIDVKFSDVAGLGKIRVELEEIVKFFTLGDMYRRRGIIIPGGVLLCGPPGVGKTLLAKAVAAEAGVNFFSISASQFVEIYVGVGASRVRALYQEAKDNAPSVVFIDELDAVGRERGLVKGSGGQERDATVNQLLVCLDGFEGRGSVITIAATNRPDILDPALVRPGRFDRKIYIPKPGLIGRKEILEVHARKKPMANDVDYMAVARMTDGMVGAELANIIEIAAIDMIRDGRTEITTDDLLQAAQIEERGILDKKERSPNLWKQIALNEAAIAVVASNFPDSNQIEFVTIAPRVGRESGYVRMKMDHRKLTEGMLSRQYVLDYITVQVAPRAADEIWYGQDQLSTVWAKIADSARSAARSYVLCGLSEKHHGLSDFWVADRLDEIDLEALRVLNMCYERSKEILHCNRKLMDAVVDELVQKKSLTKQDFFHLVEKYGHLEPLRPNILDIRSAKYAQFQELMMTKKEATQGRSL